MRYFDHAATTFLDREVAEAMSAYEFLGRGNPYRGVHSFSERATLEYEDAREKVASFFGTRAQDTICTKGTTEGLNMVAFGYAHHLHPGDEIVVSDIEHHAQALPWIRVAKDRGCIIRRLPASSLGRWDHEAFLSVLSHKTKVIACTHVSNVTGEILPLKEISSAARAVGSFISCDGAQAAGHLLYSEEVRLCDAYAVSSHKMYGPMGVGALFLSDRAKEQCDPLLLGGGILEELSSYGEPILLEGIRRYEAGTPNVTGFIGMAKACEILARDATRKEREDDCVKVLLDGLAEISGVQTWSSYGSCGIVSFSVEDMHPHDVAEELSRRGIAVRAGFHCAQRLAQTCHHRGVVRASVGRSTTVDDCRYFLEKLREII